MEDKIVFLNTQMEVKRAMGEGHFLQVKDIQRNGIHDFAASQIAKAVTMVQETIHEEVAEVPIAPVPQVSLQPEESLVSQAPVVEAPAVDVSPLEVQMPETPVLEPQVPEVPSAPSPEIAPVMDVVSEAPEVPVATPVDVVPTEQHAEVSSGVEIVEEKKEETELDVMLKELAVIDTECNQKIVDINLERENRKQDVIVRYKSKIESERTQIMDFKERAAEHLKNAQAAEQIATIAQQNAMNLQPEQPSVNVAPMMNEIPSIPTSEIPSLDEASVLSKAM